MSETSTGAIEVEESNGEVAIHLKLPSDVAFTPSSLRSFAAYLSTAADESEPSPEVDELAGILEAATAMSQTPRAIARAIIGAGFKLERS